MFEQLFKCPHALARHRHGPLDAEGCRERADRKSGQALRRQPFLRGPVVQAAPSIIAVPIRARAESREYRHCFANCFSVGLTLKLQTCQIPGPGLRLQRVSLRSTSTANMLG
jgi:hypothetical protein